MSQQNFIKPNDFSGREGIPDDHIPLWEFVDQWQKIQSGTSQQTHGILEQNDLQDTTKGQEEKLPPRLLSQESLDAITRISQHSFDKFLEGLRPRIRMWYEFTLRAIHSIGLLDNSEGDIESAELRFIMYHYLFIIFDTHESVFSKIFYHSEMLSFAAHFHRDPLQSVIWQKNQLPKNDFSDETFEKWFKYFVQMKYSLEQLRHWSQREKGLGELSDISETSEPGELPEPYQPLPFWDDLSDKQRDDFVSDMLLARAYDAVLLLAIKEMIVCAHAREVAISKKIDTYKVLHHRIVDPVKKQYFRDSIKIFKDSIKHLPDIPDNLHDHHFFLDFFQTMIEWEDIQNKAEAFVREQIGDTNQKLPLHSHVMMVGPVSNEVDVLVTSTKTSTDIEIAKIVKNMDKRRVRCHSVEKTKKIHALADLQAIEDGIEHDLDILKNKQQQAIVQVQVINQIIDEAHQITEMIHRLKEELHAMDEQRKWAHKNRDPHHSTQNSLFDDSLDIEESMVLTNLQKEYIAHIKMVQKLFISSTFDKNDSKGDGRTSDAMRNFLYFFIQKIEEGKILSETTEFSWREIYLLRKQDHQMNPHNRSDKINQNLFEILEHEDSPLSHIPGLFYRADFYQTFKSLYTLVEKYAQSKQKSLRSSKQACQLYLQNLRDAGIYHEDIDK